MAELAIAVGRTARRRLGRSLSIREVDAGSCNGCELEIHALNNAHYDVKPDFPAPRGPTSGASSNAKGLGRSLDERRGSGHFGLRFVASPRHADALMVTGPVTKNMREALERTYHAVPNLKWVFAVGDCARDGSCFADSYAVLRGVSEVIPVDLHIPGCPPPPASILQGLLSLLDQTANRSSSP